MVLVNSFDADGSDLITWFAPSNHVLSIRTLPTVPVAGSSIMDLSPVPIPVPLFYTPFSILVDTLHHRFVLTHVSIRVRCFRHTSRNDPNKLIEHISRL